MQYTIEEFCERNTACTEGRDWAIENCESMQECWEKLPDSWLVWTVLQRDVLSKEDICRFADNCAEAAWAAAWAEEAALAAGAEEAAAWAAAWAEEAALAAWAVLAAAAEEAEEAVAWAAEAARAAAWAARVAERKRQADWLRANVTPNFEKGVTLW